MPLVAYGNSDNEDGDDDDDVSIAKVCKDSRNIAPSESVVLPENLSENKFANTSNLALIKTDKEASALLLDLPQPKTSGSEIIEDDLEDIVKPKAEELALQEKPPARSQQKTRIMIPSLPSNDSDEENGPVVKKVKASGGHGLFDLLPAPKVLASIKSLVPHSVAKKSQSELTTSSSSLKQSFPASGLLAPLAAGFAKENSESDSSDEETADNFFFSQAANSAATSSRSMQASFAASGKVQGTSTMPAVAGNSNVPLRFASVGPTIVWPSSSNTASSLAEDTDEDEENDTDADSATAYASAGAGEHDATSNEISAEQLMRLQGKRNWGREMMNIVDVHADDQMSSINVVKHLSEEVSTVSHSKKNKDQVPSVQKRKHQITWLAHKAKEQEFELKQQWAENKQTKKQTQSKYGF